MQFKVGDFIRLTAEGVRLLEPFNPSVNTKSIYKVASADLEGCYRAVGLENTITGSSVLYLDSCHWIKVSPEVKLNRKLLL